jgi:DNA-binding transcriptional MerR regulator
MPEQSARKLFYKIGEVCQMTDTQPYVLRFWESEFSQLAPTKSRSGQRLYRRKDVNLVKEIKRLLYEEGYTIAGVRQKLGMTDSQGALEELFEPPAPAPAPPRVDPAPAPALILLFVFLLAPLSPLAGPLPAIHVVSCIRIPAR